MAHLRQIDFRIRKIQRLVGRSRAREGVFVLRTINEQHQTRVKIRSDSGGPSMAKKTILVIDDEEDFGELVKLNLERTTDYEVVVVTSGEAGLDLIKTHRPDLVLLDIIMPGMHGIETLERIKALTPDLPVVMMSAVWGEDIFKRCFDAGAHQFITKPVDFKHFKTAVLDKLFP